MKRGLAGRLERIEAVAVGSGGARTLWVIEVPPETVAGQSGETVRDKGIKF